MKILYFTNVSASHNFLLQAVNIDLNPGSVAKSRKCSNTIQINQRWFVCGKFFITSHAICGNKKNLVNHAMRCGCTCSSFLHLLLLYCQYDIVEKVEPELWTKQWLTQIIISLRWISIAIISVLPIWMHSQSYQFEIVALSKTCWKDNEQLLKYRQIPGYIIEFNYCEHKRGAVWRFLP